MHTFKVYTSWNKAVRKIRHVPYRTHCSLLPHLMQTVNMNSELVCHYVKLYDNMCQCNNTNANFITKYNVHGPLGRNHVHVYITEGINVDNVRARRKVRKNMFIAANNDMSATAHKIIELCESG